MKRKNILKFVSLLGIGSFVMLAAASCTSTATPTPNPEPKPNPKPEPKPDPMPNPPSGGMNGGDTNPGGGQNMMDAAAQELTAAKKVLSDLIGEESKTVELYADYAKIKADLTSAYTVAKTTSDSLTSTLDQVKTATSTLDNAIKTASTDKKTFDDQNSDLVTAYKELKSNVNNKDNNLMGLDSTQYSAIRTNLEGYYTIGADVVKKTLVPVEGMSPTKDEVTNLNTNINASVADLGSRKENADMYFNKFGKKVLVKSGVVAPKPMMADGVQTEHETPTDNSQPVNYSFVGYSVDVNGSGSTLPAWDYVKRTVFNINGTLVDNQNGDANTAPLTDVSWIYSLNNGSKYTVSFTYYGPTTAYLYFPYKLVQSSQSTTVGLNYSLNGTEAKSVEFTAPTTMNPEEMDSPAGTTQTTPETTTPATTANLTPTVDTINVAKAILTNLKFGENTIDFTVPAQKVAPMFGNFYITASEDNLDKVNDDIFGNKTTKSEESTSVTVDLLKGYNLAADYSTFFAKYTGATLDGENAGDYYLVGFIGSSNKRTYSGTGTQMNTPLNIGDKRNLIIYVNAPTEGKYYVSGIYTTGSNRALRLWANNENNFMQFVNLNSGPGNTLKTFTTNMTDSRITNQTISLNKGLNKVVIRSTNGGKAPNLGNLTFTLMKPATPSA
ncbi:VlhA.1.02 variable lipoprotein family protein [Mycoplasmoides gallisepticum str. R(low)]|uniref:VlhA.1.02 variable lipoprotein family protein n=3 Tax=Mycoplasmoides gallisepticum TaxID=2096 RepID=Q7NB57_MYCGA|nr:FIVAR domain-containing protein [Mycoplasmoides gallisepticum]AAP56773.1 VlhA.1.02 variable lipoprotein family protein [Mycoplasmoides gallisepticum str. R(low)]ADC30627.1 VlhA.1.02 variable lipoprotein family protein [Mycoplasmoides gallisepticum str. R(high)]